MSTEVAMVWFMVVVAGAGALLAVIAVWAACGMSSEADQLEERWLREQHRRDVERLREEERRAGE